MFTNGWPVTRPPERTVRSRTIPRPTASLAAGWLVERAGFGKGYPDAGAAPCRLSTKHALALTNRGGATAEDVVTLARAVRDGVHDVFGITLKPEPVLIGCML